jgi:Ser/Thr protein kinase RdoA (MazF antagonist)
VLATLRGRPAHLPPITESLGLARRALSQPQLEAKLAPADRAALANWLDRGVRHLAEDHGSTKILHGSPHDGNILSTDAGPLFIDFETVPVGAEACTLRCCSARKRTGRESHQDSQAGR